jgi:hypothetical protein
MDRAIAVLPHCFLTLSAVTPQSLGAEYYSFIYNEMGHLNVGFDE